MITNISTNVKHEVCGTGQSSAEIQRREEQLNMVAIIIHIFFIGTGENGMSQELLVELRGCLIGVLQEKGEWYNGMPDYRIELPSPGFLQRSIIVTGGSLVEIG